jgi:hypothetical protein
VAPSRRVRQALKRCPCGARPRRTFTRISRAYSRREP